MLQVLYSKEKLLAYSFSFYGDYCIVLGSLIANFTKEEIAWILAHELGHVEDSLHYCPYLDKNPVYKVCRDFFLLVLLVAYFYPLLLPLFVFIFYYLVYRWQKREYRADGFACLVIGEKIGINTLKKLQTLDGHGFSLTHPSYRSRIRNITL